ncbi:MAG: DNA repair protein RadC [Elioraea sp.]|nr:DNA repair protein RadC [Elioraea sp.]
MARRRGLAEAGGGLFGGATEATLDASEAPAGHLGHRARLRRRFLAGGAEAVADYELLELLLFAIPRLDTKPLAKALIARFGSFANVLAAPPEALRAVPGVGDAVVVALKVAQAAALKLAAAEVRDAPVLNAWDKLIAYLHAALAREPVEQVRVLYLDAKNRLKADEVHGRGTVNHTPLYPREIVRRALELQATALILVHNHPSGDPTPSRPDIELTREIREAAALFGIALHDHVIVGNGRVASFRQLGLL